jgi:uncharacterized protein YndB with AHSA1/START domain
MDPSKFTQGTIAPVEKTLHVNLAREAAFRLFTEGMASWWPLMTHSVGEQQAQTCVFEGRVGGRIYEILMDGSQVDWGRVTAWNPPGFVAFTWFPGRNEDTGQTVEVTFTDAGRGTQVELVHRGWELLGERAQPMRREYDRGWDLVLGRYIQQAAN